MPFARFQGHALDDGGNVIENCTITVRRQTIGTPIATIYSDRDGLVPLSNPFNITTGSKGYFGFHAAGGAYQIVVTSGAFSRTWTYVGIGLSQETDSIPGAPVREVLGSARVYYVRTDGNDANSGLVDSSGGAFLTIQKALDVAAALDSSIYGITIFVGAGTFNTAQTLKPCDGGGTIAIEGAGSTTIINPPAGVNHCFQGTSGGRFVLRNMKFQKNTATVGHGIFAQNGTFIQFTGIEFGTLSTGGRHIYANQGASVICTGNYTITGNALYHYSAASGGFIFCNLTVTLTGTPAFTRFADATHCGIVQVPATFTGAATGVRYVSALNAVIDTASGNTSYLPGNAGGTATTGLYA